jgi:predicted GIY-YIG superfamily endonuclease
MNGEHALYRFYDSNDCLLYIGITNDLGRRLSSHARGQPWWHKVTRATVQRFNDRDQLAASEVDAIRSEQPKYNSAHAGTPPMEKIHVKPKRAVPLWPDASRFGTDNPDPVRMKRAKVRHSFSCPVCCYPVFQDVDQHGNLVELVYCGYCARTWTPAEWRDINFPPCVRQPD